MANIYWSGQKMHFKNALFSDFWHFFNVSIYNGIQLTITPLCVYVERFLAPFLKSCDQNLFKTGPKVWPTFCKVVRKCISKMNFFGFFKRSKLAWYFYTHVYTRKVNQIINYYSDHSGFKAGTFKNYVHLYEMLIY